MKARAWLERMGCFVLILLFLAICWLFLEWATSPEVWYEGEHDGDCEIMLYQNNDYERGECNCKQRLIEAEKARFEQMKKK
jgi:hypothetical protein